MMHLIHGQFGKQECKTQETRRYQASCFTSSFESRHEINRLPSSWRHRGSCSGTAQQQVALVQTDAEV